MILYKECRGRVRYQSGIVFFQEKKRSLNYLSLPGWSDMPQRPVIMTIRSWIRIDLIMRFERCI